MTLVGSPVNWWPVDSQGKSHEPEDMSTGTSQTAMQGENGMKKKMEQTIQELWNSDRRWNKCVMGRAEEISEVMILAFCCYQKGGEK